MDIYDPISLALGLEPIQIEETIIPEDATNHFGGGLSPTSFKKGCVSWSKGKKCPQIAERARERWARWRKENPNYKDNWKKYTKKGWPKEEIERRSVAASKRNSIIIECPHCKKTGNYGNMKRWHFDRCNTLLIK